MSTVSGVRGIVQVALAASIWGAAYPLTKDVLAQVPPITFGFARFALAGLILIIVSRSLPLQGIEKEDRRRMWHLAFWGTFVLVTAMNLGLRWAPGVVSSVISGTPPLFTVLLAASWGLEPLRGRHICAAVIAIAGLFLLCGDMRGSDVTGAPAVAGIILVTIPQVAWAVYTLLGKRILSIYSWIYVCRDTFTLGAVMLAPIALFECLSGGLGLWDGKVATTLLFLAFANSVVTYGLWNSALKLIPATTAGFILYLQPVSGVILSMILFGERTGATGIAGIGLIFLALLLALRPDRPSDPRTGA